MRPLPALACATALLAGCSTVPITLQHPQTGARAQCGPYTNMHPFFPELSPHWRAERECITDYQRQGFERTPAPISK